MSVVQWLLWNQGCGHLTMLVPCSSAWVGPAPLCLRVLSKEHPETLIRSGPTPVCRLCGCMCWSWKEVWFWQSGAQTESTGVLGQGHGFQKLISLQRAIYEGQIRETIHYMKFLYTFWHERSIKILQLPLSLAIICDPFFRGTRAWVGLEKQFPIAVRFMNVFSKVEHLHTPVQEQIFAESAALPPSLNLRGGNLT